jgi:sugar phosphate isomerase/epimerase
MPSIFLSQHPQFSPLYEIVSICQDNGFGIELAAFSDIDVVYDPTQIGFHRTTIKNVTERSLHGPYLDLYPGSIEISMREKTLNCFERVYQTALDLDVHHIIFHHNYNPAACTSDQWLRYSREFWQYFLTGKSKDVKIYLENIMDESPELIAEVVRLVASPNLNIALDIGHVHAYSKQPLSVWIESLKDKIGYVHLHDNHGQEDEHLGLGRGNIPLIETLNALSLYAPDAIWSLESGGIKMYQSLEWLGEYNILLQGH